MASKRQKKKQAKLKLAKFKGKKNSISQTQKLGSALKKTIRIISKIKAKKPKRKRALYKVKKQKVLKPIVKTEEVSSTVNIEPIKKQNYYISGQFDDFAISGVSISNNGIKSALNRLIDVHPELDDLIEEYQEAGGNMATLEYLFTEYYFEAREDVYLDYSANPFGTYEEGYLGFVSALKQKIEILKDEAAMYAL